MPSGTFEVPHHHLLSCQFFYVLSGILTMVVDGQTMNIMAGTGVEIAPGTVHQARNDSDADIRFLVISQPPSHNDRIVAKV